VYIGLTVNHARMYHFYLANHLEYTPHGQDALMMYAGALLWMVSVGAAIFRGIFTFTPVGRLFRAGVRWLFYHIGKGLRVVLRSLWILIRGIVLLLFFGCCQLAYGVKLAHWKFKNTDAVLEDRPTCPVFPHLSEIFEGLFEGSENAQDGSEAASVVSFVSSIDPVEKMGFDYRLMNDLGWLFVVSFCI
jgi:hypothetical protein